MSETQETQLTKKDFVSDQAVRWCPGCGDYAILAQAQKQMPTFGRKREDIVFVSGIGCSSRFPYYMNTYGFHYIKIVIFLMMVHLNPILVQRKWIM